MLEFKNTPGFWGWGRCALQNTHACFCEMQKNSPICYIHVFPFAMYMYFLVAAAQFHNMVCTTIQIGTQP